MSDSAEYRPVRPALSDTVLEGVTFLRQGWAPMVVPPGLPRGDGGTVLVLPVIGRGDAHTARMREALDGLGHRAMGWNLGLNRGPTPVILDGISRRLRELYILFGPVSVVGFSLGGVFARLLAHRHPAMVRQVATVCSPFRATLDSAFLPLRPLLPLWRMPDLAELSRLAAAPLPVPGTFVYSRADGIVAWESCVDPALPQDCFEIAGRHVGIASDPDVLRILAGRLCPRPDSAP